MNYYFLIIFSEISNIYSDNVIFIFCSRSVLFLLITLYEFFFFFFYFSHYSFNVIFNNFTYYTLSLIKITIYFYFSNIKISRNNDEEKEKFEEYSTVRQKNI